MKLAVKSLKNKKVKDIEVPDEVFAYPFKEHLIHSAVRSCLAAGRRGTHKTKTRAEVAGSGRKPWRQKGTGRARVGSIRSPLWRSGGTTHGPRPRNYADKLSVQEKRNALKSALSRKLRDNGKST
jgi:large subunit ribosomal protein L4